VGVVGPSLYAVFWGEVVRIMGKEVASLRRIEVYNDLRPEETGHDTLYPNCRVAG
jgi:hypothetical protein